MITEELKKRFLFNRDETGRFIVKSFTTGKEYYVEPIGDGRVGEWGSYNPGTGNIEHKKGAGKYTGSVKPEESLITEENGFINIWETPIGSSPFAESARRAKAYEFQGIKSKT